MTAPAANPKNKPAKKDKLEFCLSCFWLNFARSLQTKRRALALQFQILGHFFVFLFVIFLEKFHQFFSLGDHSQQSPSGMFVFGVLFQMSDQFLNFCCEKGYLVLRRTGIFFVSFELFCRIRLLARC